MESVEEFDDEDKPTKDILRTKLRGRTIELSSDKINELLGSQESVVGEEMNDIKAYRILMQTNDYPGELNFPPKQMSDFHRIIHYIYSRSMVNKSGSFSHLNQLDYLLLARIISGERLNIGGLIFSEMKDFVLNKSKSTPIPYPQLVTYFLQTFNVNPFEAGELKVKVPPFGLVQINKMKIPVPLQSKKDKGKAPATSASKVPDEAHSSAGPAQSSAPSFLQSSIQRMFQTELQVFEERIMSKVKEVGDSVDKRLKVMGNTLSLHRQASLELYNELCEKYDTLHKEVLDIKTLVTTYLSTLPPTEPSFTEEELFPYPTPSASASAPIPASILSVSHFQFHKSLIHFPLP